MPYTYASFQAALALEMIIPNANVLDPNFIAILPTIIDYAEQRCYRELDCIHAEVSQHFPMTAYVRSQSFAVANAIMPPAGAQQILLPERVLILPPTWAPTPSPTGAPPTTGYQTALPATIDFIDEVFAGVFPAPGPFGVPRYFALRDDVTLTFGPGPDQTYFFQIQGKARPIPLYQAPPADGTQTTFLTTVLPDLFLAAAMVSAAGYRHNFGSQSDDPKMAVSWEAQYNELLGSAKNEETRKRFLGWSGMASYSQPPQAAPTAPQS